MMALVAAKSRRLPTPKWEQRYWWRRLVDTNNGDSSQPFRKIDREIFAKRSATSFANEKCLPSLSTHSESATSVRVGGVEPGIR